MSHLVNLLGPKGAEAQLAPYSADQPEVQHLLMMIKGQRRRNHQAIVRQETLVKQEQTTAAIAPETLKALQETLNAKRALLQQTLDVGQTERIANKIIIDELKGAIEEAKKTREAQDKVIIDQLTPESEGALEALKEIDKLGNDIYGIVKVILIFDNNFPKAGLK